MSKRNSNILIQIRFIDLMNHPFPNLYHEVRVSGNKYAASAGKSDNQGLGVWIEKPVGTQLDILVRNPLTKELVPAKNRIIVQKKGIFRVQAPFSVQRMKLRQLSEGGSTLRKTYKILPGDDLYSIAKKFGTTWQILFELNKDQIKQPDQIFPGRWIKIPPKGSSLTGTTNERPDSLKSQTHYKVKKGETLSGISQRSGVSVQELQRINGISRPEALQTGQTIKLRGNSSAKPQTSTKPTSPVTETKPTTSSSNEKEDGVFDGAMETMTDIAKGTFGVIGGAVGSIGDGLGVLGEKAKGSLEGLSDAMDGGKNDKPARQTTGADNNTPSTSGIYTVKRGDTLSGIAQKNGVNTNDLAHANGLKLTNTIHPGDKLNIPKGGSSTSSSSSSQSSKRNNPIHVTTKPGNSTNGTPKEIATTNGSCTCKAHNLIWSTKVNCEFRKKVIKICQELWPDDYLKMANNLMALMHLETEGTFDPSKVNSLGFVGLVQIGADARKDLGVSKDRLRNMSAVEQLDWVKKYFQLYNNRYKNIDSFLEMYLTILYPKTVKPAGVDVDDNDIIFRNNGKAKGNPYKQNPSFMKEKGEWKKRGFSGGVTYAWEVKEEISHHYDDGKKAENRSFKSICFQVVQPPIASNPVESAPWMEIAIREARQWAGYHETKSKSSSKPGSKGVITDNYHKLVGVVIGGNKPYTPSLTTAWCASFINYCLKEKKYAHTKDPSSQFPTKYPEKFIKISKPVYGAIVVYKHTNRAYGTGHVALVYAKLNNGDYAVLGGNQGESITLNTHKGVYLDSLKCKFVGYYIPKSYKSIADSLIQNNIEFIKTVSLSEAKKSLNDSTGVTLTTK